MKKLIIAFAFIVLCLVGGATTPAMANSSPGGFEDLAEKLLPTVVNVSTSMKVETPQMGAIPNFPMFPPGSPFEEFFKQFRGEGQENGKSIERKVTSLGSGFVIDASKGYIVTNYHVVKNAEEIKIILNDNTNIDAELVGSDEKVDIAVLKVKTNKKLIAAKWGDSSNLRVGSWIIAIGNPFGLGGTVTAGIVSARQRNINSGPYDDYIQTDASINKGNSGGPMFDMSGNVVGVNTAIYSPSGGSVGIGFAVPSNLAQNVVDQLIKYGKTRRGWLGVRIQKVTPEIAENLGMKKPMGALIASVNDKGPAHKAKIKAGDVITKFNGHEIKEMHNLPKLVAETEVGKKVEVELWRGGKAKTVTVVLGQLEKAEDEGLIKGSSSSKDLEDSDTLEIKDLGLSLSSIDDRWRQQFSIADSVKGVVVTKVAMGSAAAEKGVMAGDVIVEVNQQEVSDAKAAEKIITKAKKAKKSSVLLFIMRGEDMRFVALKFKK